jgi:hypothetical protein
MSFPSSSSSAIRIRSNLPPAYFSIQPIIANLSLRICHCEFVIANLCLATALPRASISASSFFADNLSTASHFSILSICTLFIQSVSLLRHNPSRNITTSLSLFSHHTTTRRFLSSSHLNNVSSHPFLSVSSSRFSPHLSLKVLEISQRRNIPMPRQRKSSKLSLSQSRSNTARKTMLIHFGCVFVGPCSESRKFKSGLHNARS